MGIQTHKFTDNFISNKINKNEENSGNFKAKRKILRGFLEITNLKTQKLIT